MKRNKRRAVFVVALFVFFCAPGLFANPFLGSGDAQKAAPVRSGKPPEELRGMQRRVQQLLGSAFYDYRDGTAALGTIAAFAFLYGMIHAAGPGHRKTVVFSLYLTRAAPFWEPAVSGALLAFLHGGLSLALLCIFRVSVGALSLRADAAALWLEGCSYVALILISAGMALGAVRRLRRFVRRRSDNATADNGAEPAKQSATSLAALFFTGLYPCPGAILVLILSVSLDMTAAGIAAVCAMSAGMCVPIIICGYLAWFGRTGLFSAFKRRERQARTAAAAAETAGWLFLLFFAVYTASPFVAGLFRRIVR